MSRAGKELAGRWHMELGRGGEAERYEVLVFMEATRDAVTPQAHCLNPDGGRALKKLNVRFSTMRIKIEML